ncbi:hypothetical protein BDC45DRAFT_432604 [Circinella umbellata]|nr:hypothetical protein BDC45DRAFT_432604 [Circinella umbellata]
MLLQRAISLAALGLLAFTSNTQTVNAEPLAVVHGTKGETIKISANYLAAFDSDDAPETPFELVEADDVSSKLISLKKRGAGCADYHTVVSSDSCVSVAKKYGISLNEFYNMNPKVHRGSCDNLDDGKSYCVAKGGSSSGKSKKKTSSGKSKKKTSNGSSGGSDKRKKIQSKAAFTYYWIAQAEDNPGGKKVAIKTCAGKTIAKVNENYADALVMEGTGVVNNKIVNLGGCSCSNYKCFEEINRSEEPYGITAYGSALRPYTSIAANDLEKGSKIYVPELDGWSLPNSNKKHNGCLLVDDQSWSFESNHIDFYVYEMNNYEKLDKQHRVTKVDIYEGGNCKLLNYL